MSEDRRDWLNAPLGGLEVDRRQALGLAALIGAGAAAASCASPPRRDVLRIATNLQDYADIHSSAWPNTCNVVNPVMDYLCVVDAQGRVQGALFESWTVSPDLKTWTFNIRQGVRWRKGELLTADHILWNLWRWVDPTVGSAYLSSVLSYMMTKVEDPNAKDGAPKERWVPWDRKLFEKIDDHTIRLNLKTPSVTVCEDFFTSSSLIAHPAEGGVFKAGCDGTGPFELIHYRVNDKAVYQAVEGSWRGRAKLDRLELVDVGSDPAAISAALFSGQIDGLTLVPLETADVQKRNPNIRLYTAPSSATLLVRMHCDYKPFDDPRVRKALRLAVDPETVLRLAQSGWGTLGEHHHVSTAQLDHAPMPAAKPDLAEAKRLLAEAGYPNGFTTSIVASSNQQTYVKTAQVLAAMWGRIGVKAAIRPVPLEDYVSHWKDYPLSITYWTHRPLGIMQFALSYRTGALYNEARYSNPEVDALIEKALGILDPIERRPVMLEIQKLMQEDGPLVQCAFVPQTSAFHKDVRGVQAHAMGHFPFERISLQR